MEKQIVLYYANYVVQIALPSRLDSPRLFYQEVVVPIFPNVATLAHQEKYGQPQLFIRDFTEATKKKKEPQQLSFSIGQYTKLPITKRGKVWMRRKPTNETKK